MKSLIKKIYPDDTVLQLEIDAIRVICTLSQYIRYFHRVVYDLKNS